MSAGCAGAYGGWMSATVVWGMLFLAGCGESPPPPPPPLAEAPEVRFQESRFFRAHDLFLATANPRVAPVAEAELADNDEVFGLVVEGHARAYRVGELCYHHVINDQIGGVPIAVTY